MDFFRTRKAGVSENEWQNARSRVRGIFGWSGPGKKKADDVERLIKAHLDPEHGSKDHRVMTREELDEALHDLEKDKRITVNEARKIRNVLDRDLRD